MNHNVCYSAFSDDTPETHLNGTVVAIHISDAHFAYITDQRIDFDEALIEYPDKLLRITHADGAIHITPTVRPFRKDIFCHTLRPPEGETITFHNIVSSDSGQVKCLEYRWKDSWLFIIAAEFDLVLARDIVPYGELSPSTDGEYPLNFK